MKTFLGYVRPDGRVGIRNYMLIVANGHGSGNLALLAQKTIRDSRVWVMPQEQGRTAEDRAAIVRVMVGLAKNPNVGAVLIVGHKAEGGYPEFTREGIVGAIMESGKPVDTVFIDECGGFYNGLGECMRKGRRLAQEASEFFRREVEFGKLFVGVKCGHSDASSGIAGNPAIGHLFDRLVEAGGSAIFGETTEVIGAEHLLAKRFADEGDRAKFLAAVERVENEAKATGEDIRTINPIPANIKAGLTTLEEKSLGAMVKAGTKPLHYLEYAEAAKGKGLFFMDSWMSSTTLFPAFAAAGAVLTLFQMGGGWQPDNSFPPGAFNGVVAPTMYCTGNPRTWQKMEQEMDFNAGPVITDGESIASAGDRLIELVCKVASGKVTKAETLSVYEGPEVYTRGPAL